MRSGASPPSMAVSAGCGRRSACRAGTTRRRRRPIGSTMRLAYASGRAARRSDLPDQPCGGGRRHLPADPEIRARRQPDQLLAAGGDRPRPRLPAAGPGRRPRRCCCPGPLVPPGHRPPARLGRARTAVGLCGGARPAAARPPQARRRDRQGSGRPARPGRLRLRESTVPRWNGQRVGRVKAGGRRRQGAACSAVQSTQPSWKAAGLAGQARGSVRPCCSAHR